MTSIRIVVYAIVLCTFRSQRIAFILLMILVVDSFYSVAQSQVVHSETHSPDSPLHHA